MADARGRAGGDRGRRARAEPRLFALVVLLAAAARFARATSSKMDYLPLAHLRVDPMDEVPCVRCIQLYVGCLRRVGALNEYRRSR